MTSPSTRLIFPDELQPGTVILEKCGGTVHCQRGTTHEAGRVHELTVLRTRARADAAETSAIVVDEDGEQIAWSQIDSAPIRVMVPADAGTPEQESTR